MREFLEVARRAADEAAVLLKEHAGRVKSVEHKGPTDLITEIDRWSEELICGIIGESFPDHEILAEESGVRGGSAGYRWIIDPVDGTTNYAHGHSMYAVSIALEKEGETLVGVVALPAFGERFEAVRGGGATLNGAPLRVSKTDDLGEALLTTGFAYDRRVKADNYLPLFKAFMARTVAVRVCGSAAADLCFVASGRIDGCWEEKLKPWDVAAGTLIVREAGGRVTDFGGRESSPYDDVILSSNGLLHDRMLAIIGDLFVPH